MTPQIRELEAQVARLTTLLERTVRLAGSRELSGVGIEALDAVLSVLGAQRGFVGLVDGAGWELVAGRDLQQRALPLSEAQISSTVVRRVVENLETVLESDALEGDQPATASVSALQLRSIIALPILREGGSQAPIGFLYLDDTRFVGLFDGPALKVVQAWLPVVAEALHRAIEARRVQSNSPFPTFLTRHPSLARDLAELARIAQFDAPILLTGETGTGKSVLARAIHTHSPRAAQPFVHVNCGAIPESLLEGELFGTERGAFTGAERRAGRFEAAQGGTLFLDEIDSMPAACQAKLLVALQDGTVTRLGSNTPIHTDVRVLAATNVPPQQSIMRGTLRQDVYYRLALAEVRIPPLRQRPEDLEPLVQRMLHDARQRYALGPLSLSEGARQQLVHHRWPGNVRELENAVRRAALLAVDGRIDQLRLDPLEPDLHAPAAPAVPTYTRRRYATSREDFLAAWDASTTAGECAARLGLSERSVYRLKRRYLGAVERDTTG